MHATTLCARALAQPPDTGVRFFQLGLSILCCCRPNHLKIKISVSILLATRDGHAPIFADAHQCASDAHNLHKPHPVVNKSQLFLTNILWLWVCSVPLRWPAGRPSRRAAVRLSGRPNTRAACITLPQCGCPALWLSDLMVVRHYGCLILWLSDTPVCELSTWNLMIVRPYGRPSLWSSELMIVRTYGCPVKIKNLWFDFMVVRWKCRTYGLTLWLSMLMVVLLMAVC